MTKSMFLILTVINNDTVELHCMSDEYDKAKGLFLKVLSENVAGWHMMKPEEIEDVLDDGYFDQPTCTHYFVDLSNTEGWDLWINKSEK